MSKSFKSYVNHFQENARNSTFKAYVDIFVPPSENTEMDTRSSQFFEDELTPRLLPGEKIIASAARVSKLNSFSEIKQGIPGTLFVTNFKLSFVTLDRSTYNDLEKRQRNLIVSDADIPLTAVDTIYQIQSGNRRRKLAIDATPSGHTKYLEIHCKNLQILTFWFKLASKEDTKRVTNAAAHYIFPKNADLLFAYDYGMNMKQKDDVTDTKLFESFIDWNAEIARQNASWKWRVASVNEGYRFSISLPEYFVVPANLLDVHLKEAGQQFIDQRLPIWSFTYKNEASLVRMSACDTSRGPEIEQSFIEAIRLTNKDPGADNKQPIVVDLTKSFPLVKDVQQSFEKFKELFVTDKLKDFWSLDQTWLSQLGETRWLLLTGHCLRKAGEILRALVHGDTMILKETSSRDMCCVISCLVQLLADPYCRTISGFQELVQREWVAMGHPFQTRFGLVNHNDDEQGPVFLLFLDCVWQLLQQFPISFAFTETYLTTVWDSVHMGLFQTFLFDSKHQQSQFFNTPGRIPMYKSRLPSVWNWQLQFSDEDRSLFNNPLYVLKSSLSKVGIFIWKPSDSYLPCDDDRLDIIKDMDLLYPCSCAAIIKIWTQCYLRWSLPVQIIGGGNPSQYLQQCLLVEEILGLQNDLANLQDEVDSERRLSSNSRPRSNLIFNMEASQTPKLLQSSFLTSSFPFSPSCQRENVFYRPVSMYLMQRGISNDFIETDD